MRHITANGETRSVAGWAKYLGVSENVVRGRLRHYPPDEAIRLCILFKGQIFGKSLKYNGVEKTVTDWAKETGIDRKTILRRMRSGYSPEQCLYKGSLLTGRPQSATSERRSLTRLKKEGSITAWKENIARGLEAIDTKGKTYRVRWCDRTSHSHTWYTERVPVSELDEFIGTHYLARVVGV